VEAPAQRESALPGCGSIVADGKANYEVQKEDSLLKLKVRKHGKIVLRNPFDKERVKWKP
jgi:hypothetical protein